MIMQRGTFDTEGRKEGYCVSPHDNKDKLHSTFRARKRLRLGEAVLLTPEGTPCKTDGEYHYTH